MIQITDTSAIQIQSVNKVEKHFDLTFHAVGLKKKSVTLSFIREIFWVQLQ